MGQYVVAAKFIFSSAVRENDAPIRCAKHFPAALCPPASSRRGPGKRTAHEEFPDSSAAAHSSVALGETTVLPALYEIGEARHLCRNPSLNSVRSP